MPDDDVPEVKPALIILDAEPEGWCDPETGICAPAAEEAEEPAPR